MELRIREEDDLFSAAPADNNSDAGDIVAVATSTSMSQQAINIINFNARQARKAHGYDGYKPRTDRGVEPNANNAQGLFAPEANVFVAK